MLKIKLFLISEKGKDFLIILIIILVGLISFLLGRLSNQESSEGLKIRYQDQEALVLSSSSLIKAGWDDKLSVPQNSSKNSLGEYFASNRGKKYYPINCSAGKNIKIENRVYFKTAQEAEKAGYELSSSCY